MKKLFAIMSVAFILATASYAQATFNIRVGGGLHQAYSESYSSYNYSYGYNYYYYDDGIESYPSAAFVFETNIPLGGRASKFVFSPSLFIASDCLNLVAFNVPLYFGYKIPMSSSSIFIPKIGPMLGYDISTNSDVYSDFAAGLSAEIAFEIKHFIIAANVDVNLYNENAVGALCTVGYKF